VRDCDCCNDSLLTKRSIRLIEWGAIIPPGLNFHWYIHVAEENKGSIVRSKA
jgi:hypothetical protein